MDGKSKLHKKIKNLSPIKKSEENFNKNQKEIFNVSQKEEEKDKTLNLNKSNISAIPDASSVKVIPTQKDPLQIKYPKNINEYRHIMADSQTVNAELTWILDLRTYSQRIKYHGLRNATINKPRFYDEDHDKYTAKVEKERKLKEKEFSNARNTNQFEHLIEKRLGSTANFSQFGFETTLRNFKSNKDLKATESNWHNLPYKTTNKFFPLVNDAMGSTSTSKNSAFRLSAYEPVYDVTIIIILLESRCGQRYY